MISKRDRRKSLRTPSPRPARSSRRKTNPNNKAPLGPRRPRLSSFRCNCQIAFRGRSPEARRTPSRRRRRNETVALDLFQLRPDTQCEPLRPPPLSREESSKIRPNAAGPSLPLERSSAVGARRYREAAATCQTLFREKRVRPCAARANDAATPRRSGYGQAAKEVGACGGATRAALR